MLFAAKETIRYMLMVLPDTTQTFLHSQRVGELTNLLKLINTYYYFDPLLLSDTLRKVEYFLWRIVLWCYA